MLKVISGLLLFVASLSVASFDNSLNETLGGSNLTSFLESQRNSVNETTPVPEAADVTEASHVYGDFVDFTRNCTLNERLVCLVHDSCNFQLPRTTTFPSAPHDLRVHSYLVANSKRHPDSYELWVNLTWYPPYDKSYKLVAGFEVTIVDKSTNEQHCFVLYMPKPEWQQVDRELSRQFKFSTKNLFKFDRDYYVEVQTLPKPPLDSDQKNHAEYHGSMPEHPGRYEVPPHQFLVKHNLTETPQADTQANCSGKGHKHAHQWLPSLRRAVVYPHPKDIYIEFVAAPPHFCFEKYEIRLYKSKSDRYERSVIVGPENIFYEEHSSKLENGPRTVWAAYGNYTFTAIPPGSYDIAIVPVDYDENHKCLCPIDDYGSMCSCSMAKWPDIVMPNNSADQNPKFPIKPFPFPARNGTAGGGYDNPLQNTVVLVALLCASVGTVAVAIASILLLYRKYKRGAAFRMWLLPTIQPKPSQDKDGAELKLINRPMQVLLVYSHDCPQHEQVVRAFAEFLSANCMCDVIVDYANLRDISANKFDWVYRSLAADKVILINSVGAFLRYEGKFQTPPTLIQRTDANSNDALSSCAELDELFLLQLDRIQEEFLNNRYAYRPSSVYNSCSVPIANGHCKGAVTPELTPAAYQSPLEKFISVYFSYTPQAFVLNHVIPHARYELTRDIEAVVMAIHNIPAANRYDPPMTNVSSSLLGLADPEFLKGINDAEYWHTPAGDNLRNAIDVMARYQRETPNWFEQWHVRCPIVLASIKLQQHRTSPTSARKQLAHPKSLSPKHRAVAESFSSDAEANVSESVKVPLISAEETADDDVSDVAMTTVDSGIAPSVSSSSTIPTGSAVAISKPHQHNDVHLSADSGAFSATHSIDPECSKSCVPPPGSESSSHETFANPKNLPSDAKKRPSMDLSEKSHHLRGEEDTSESSSPLLPVNRQKSASLGGKSPAGIEDGFTQLSPKAHQATPTQGTTVANNSAGETFINKNNPATSNNNLHSCDSGFGDEVATQSGSIPMVSISGVEVDDFKKQKFDLLQSVA